jgi:hypothetical protein
MPQGNGNKVKGNNEKKVARNRKKQVIAYDESIHKFARVVSLDGGKHLKAIPQDSLDKTPLDYLISGKHHKRVWFRKDDIIVVADGEVLGKLDWCENIEINKIKHIFEKIDGGNTGIEFYNDDNYTSDEEENENDDGTVKVMPQRIVEDINIDDI